MTEREKVIRGLEVCSTVEDLAPCPNECPYHKPDAVCYGTARLMRDALALLREQEPDIVRCKDCIHCGHADTSNLLWGRRPTPVFPDDKCPCQCDDYYYSWLPDPDWFCANGERRVSEDG